MKSILARHGQCDEMITDNGPQYTSKEFEEFAMDWNFKHTRSIPYYHQSNGLAEKYVGIAKNIFKKAKQDKQDVYQGLLTYRSTPGDDIPFP